MGLNVSLLQRQCGLLGLCGCHVLFLKSEPQMLWFLLHSSEPICYQVPHSGLLDNDSCQQWPLGTITKADSVITSSQSPFHGYWEPRFVSYDSPSSSKCGLGLWAPDRQKFGDKSFVSSEVLERASPQFLRTSVISGFLGFHKGLLIYFRHSLWNEILNTTFSKSFSSEWLFAKF